MVDASRVLVRIEAVRVRVEAPHHRQSRFAFRYDQNGCDMPLVVGVTLFGNHRCIVMTLA